MTTLDEYTQYTRAVQGHGKPASAPTPAPRPVVDPCDVAALNLGMTRGKPAETASEEAPRPQEGPAPRLGRAQLAAMPGLDNVKKAVSAFTSQMRFDQHRLALDLPVARQTQHFVFTGNPGTGKTTVARVLGQIMYEEGYLARGHVVECHARDLIAEFVGSTGPRVMNCVHKAQGGILFIDEAYGLLNHAGSRSSFSDEAITTLLAAMENLRDSFTVIVAGYPAEMLRFVEANPGLKSRFTRFIAFDDYEPAELEAIFTRMAQDLSYVLDPGAMTSLKWAMDRGQTIFLKNFSNGRFVRNFFESTIRHMATRLETRLDHGADLTRTDMTVIMGCDIDAAWEELLRTPR